MAQIDLPPPAKKMRFEDGASPSPYSPVVASPTTPYLQLPGMQSPHSFNSPQPLYPTSEMLPPRGTPGGIMGPPMAPPVRPIDRSQQQNSQQNSQQNQQSGERQSREQMTDMNTITDVLFGTDLDLRAEEQMMQSSYYSQQSFTSQSSLTAAGDSFQFPSFGPLSSQDAASQDSTEQELMRKHAEVARRFAERKQAPLYDPFLQINVVRTRMQQKAFDNGIRLNLDGLFVKTEERAKQIPVRTRISADGTGIVAGYAGSSSWVQANAQLVDVFSLLTLATNERLRNITEEAYALARGRQATADGIVDPRYSDLATSPAASSEAQAIPLAISGTAWDDCLSAVSPMTIPNKRKFGESGLSNGHRLPTPPSEPSPTPQSTTAFANELANSLRHLARQEREAERARLQARERRKQAALAKAAGLSAGGSASGAGGSPATPGGADATAAQIAPDLSKMSKKEQNNLKKAAKNTSEDVLRANSNTTASMALGGRKRAWQTASAPAVPKLAQFTPHPGLTAVPSSSAIATMGSGAGVTSAAIVPNQEKLRAREQKFGEWKEAGPFGGGVQLRDVAYVLERDGKARKSLARILARQGSGDVLTDREFVDVKSEG